MHIKNIHCMVEKLSEAAKHEVETKSIKDINAKELGEVIDMIKDLSEAEYYAKITKAMEESEYGEDYDKDGPLEQRMYYRGQPRDSMGRFTSGRRGRRGGRRGYEMMMPMDDVYDEDYWRQMDMMQGKMFYPESRYDNNIDWNSNDSKYFLYYKHNIQKVCIAFWSFDFYGTPVFSSREIAKSAIDTIGEERLIKEYFKIEKEKFI